MGGTFGVGEDDETAVENPEDTSDVLLPLLLDIVPMVVGSETVIEKDAIVEGTVVVPVPAVVSEDMLNDVMW